MKVLYHHRTRSSDGQSVHINELIHALRSLGHEVTIVGTTAQGFESFGAGPGFVGYLKAILPRACYELLELAYSLPLAARLYAAHRRNPADVIYERYNLHLLSGVLVKWLTGKPLLLEVNAPLADERAQFGRLSLIGLAQWTEGFVWRNADAVLPVTRVLAQLVKSRGVPDGRICVVANGVNQDFLSRRANGAEVRRRLGVGDRIVLGFVGFLREWHGLEKIINLIKRSGERLNLHAIIIGDGPALATLQALSQELGVQGRVTFTGLIQRPQIIEHLAAFDIALQPHVVPYASPLKLIEYMSMGLAVVAPASANIEEIVQHGQNGLLFAVGDSDAFEQAVERVSTDAALRSALGQKARATVVERDMTWLGNARQVIDLARRLQSPAAGAPASARGDKAL